MNIKGVDIQKETIYEIVHFRPSHNTESQYPLGTVVRSYLVFLVPCTSFEIHNGSMGPTISEDTTFIVRPHPSGTD